MLDWYCCGKPLNDWDELQCSELPGYITRCEVCGCWYIVYDNGAVRRVTASELRALPLAVAGNEPTQLPT